MKQWAVMGVRRSGTKKLFVHCSERKQLWIFSTRKAAKECLAAIWKRGQTTLEVDGKTVEVFWTIQPVWCEVMPKESK